MREDNLSTLQIPAFSIGVMTDVLRRAGIDPTRAFEQSGLDVGNLSGFKPPYGKQTQATLKRELKK